MSDAKTYTAQELSWPTAETVREVVDAVVRECPGYLRRDLDAMAEGWNPADCAQEEQGYVWEEAYCRLVELVDPEADARGTSTWDDSEEWLLVLQDLSDALWDLFHDDAVALLPGAFVARTAARGEAARLLDMAVAHRVAADRLGDRLGEDAYTRAERAVAVALCGAVERIAYMEWLDQLQMWKLEGCPAHNALHRALHDHFEAMVEEAKEEAREA